MRPRITLITLGVADVARARAFYERLGFRASADSQESVAFFEAGGTAMAVWSREALADDADIADRTQGFAGVAIAHNCLDEAEVDAVLAEAVAAGATLVKPAKKVFWGGYSGYFADPDGHLWEVAYNPHWPIDADGKVTLQPPA